jgi:S-adenosylmethionine hydrolase
MLIALCTDFGSAGPYLGQMRLVLAREAPGVPVVDLVHDLPRCDPRASAYLLAAYTAVLSPPAVCVAVVDPGVGGTRPPLVLEADGRWFVGPGNGLLSLVARRAGRVRWSRIDWRPATLSPSFHGRDLFAPVAARIARGSPVAMSVGAECADLRADWPDDLPEVLAVDAYGNAITGLRAASLGAQAGLRAAGQTLARADSFSEVAEGAAFWYANANGLVEIAVNKGSAARTLGLAPGHAVAVIAA